MSLRNPGYHLITTKPDDLCAWNHKSENQICWSPLVLMTFLIGMIMNNIGCYIDCCLNILNYGKIPPICPCLFVNVLIVGNQNSVSVIQMDHCSYHQIPSFFFLWFLSFGILTSGTASFCLSVSIYRCTTWISTGHCTVHDSYPSDEISHCLKFLFYFWLPFWER
jgi:hypothetical protein